MTANRFFLPQPALPDSVFWIEGAEHHHLSRQEAEKPDAGRGPSAGPIAQVCLLVGPEGGWSSGEKALVRECGFRPVSLGRSVLSTETAALCAAFLVNHFWNP